MARAYRPIRFGLCGDGRADDRRRRWLCDIHAGGAKDRRERSKAARHRQGVRRAEHDPSARRRVWHRAGRGGLRPCGGARDSTGVQPWIYRRDWRGGFPFPRRRDRRDLVAGDAPEADIGPESPQHCTRCEDMKDVSMAEGNGAPPTQDTAAKDTAAQGTAAFERLIEKLRPQLHRYCARMTGSVIDGEDVLQEALLKAVEASPQTLLPTNPDGWLFRVAHNAAIDYLRRRARHVATHAEEDLDMIAAPTDAVHDRQIAAASLRTFMRLPVRQRGAVILRDVLGYSVEEICDITSTGILAVRGALQRGRLRLHELAHEPDDPAGPPTYFILLEWTNDRVATIRDFLFARYAVEGADIVALGAPFSQSEGIG